VETKTRHLFTRVESGFRWKLSTTILLGGKDHGSKETSSTSGEAGGESRSEGRRSREVGREAEGEGQVRFSLFDGRREARATAPRFILRRRSGPTQSRFFAIR
jgi:hypothetical protein